SPHFTCQSSALVPGAGRGNAESAICNLHFQVNARKCPAATGMESFVSIPDLGDREENRAVTDVLTLILAGGKGTRLDPLTRDRAKPAVPFGGLYRIVDFTLSNCINSGLRRALVLTQYKARSLDRHIAAGWSFLSRQLDEYIEVLPPQQRI